jgi:hypothetical protein
MHGAALGGGSPASKRWPLLHGPSHPQSSAPPSRATKRRFNLRSRFVSRSSGAVGSGMSGLSGRATDRWQRGICSASRHGAKAPTPPAPDGVDLMQRTEGGWLATSKMLFRHRLLPRCGGVLQPRLRSPRRRKPGHRRSHRPWRHRVAGQRPLCAFRRRPIRACHQTPDRHVRRGSARDRAGRSLPADLILPRGLAVPRRWQRRLLAASLQAPSARPPFQGDIPKDWGLGHWRGERCGSRNSSSPSL